MCEAQEEVSYAWGEVVWERGSTWDVLGLHGAESPWTMCSTLRTWNLAGRQAAPLTGVSPGSDRVTFVFGKVILQSEWTLVSRRQTWRQKDSLGVCRCHGHSHGEVVQFGMATEEPVSRQSHRAFCRTQKLQLRLPGE